MIKAVAKRAKIDKRVTPHTFRRSFATNLFNQGESEIHIRDLLGHKSSQTT